MWVLDNNENKFLREARDGDLKKIIELTTPVKRGKKALISIDKHDDIRDWFGETAFIKASRNGCLKVVKFLLQKKVNVNGKNSSGSTALHAASYNGHVNVIKCLIAHGANLNQQSNLGVTALHNVSRRGKLNAAKLLLQKGANPFIKNKKNLTAFDLAERFKHHNIANFIIQTIQQHHQTSIPPAMAPLPPPIDNYQDANMKTIYQFPNEPEPTITIPNQLIHDDDSIIQESRNLLQHAIHHPESSDSISNLSPQYILQFTQKSTNSIGKGTYGNVYLAKDPKISPSHFAIKVFDLSDIRNVDHKRQLIQSYKKETATLKRFRHPNIITLYGTSNLSQDKFALVVEYANKGSLDSFLKDDANRARLAADTRISIMFQLARSIHFLHTGGRGGLNKVLHRDIKPSNICLTNNFQVKLIDCGLAKIEQDPNAGESQLGSVTPSLFTSGYHGPAGTRGYRCPVYDLTNECVEGSDVFSLGVVFAELIVGCLQGGQATRNGKVFGLMYDTYVWDRLEHEAIVDGHEKLVEDADTAIVWNPNILQEISEIAIQCMAPTLKKRKTTLDLVGRLNQILGQALLERTTTTTSDNNQESFHTIDAISNLSFEISNETADTNADFTPCWLCNRNLANDLKCSEGHAFCRPCACEIVVKHLNAGSSSFCCCVSGCKSEPFFDKDLFRALPFEIYEKYRIQKSHIDFMHKILFRLDSVHQDVKENQDILRGISNQLTRSIMALGTLTVRGAKLCPNLVWMVPTKMLFKTNPIQWFRQKTIGQTYQIVFICQHSWEIAHKPFEVTVPHHWLVKVAPLLKICLFVLSTAVAVNNLPFPDVNIKEFDKKIQAMEEFVNSVVRNDAENGKDVEAMMANANTWVQKKKLGNDLSFFEKGKLRNLLGQGLEMIREKAYRAENLKLWTKQIVPVPLREQEVDSLGVKWVKEKYKKLYYSS